MKKFKTYFWTAILITSLLWTSTQGDTTDAGKIIRLFVTLYAAYMFTTRTIWGVKLQRIINF